MHTSFLSKFSTFLTRDWKASAEWWFGVPRLFSVFISVQYACVPFALTVYSKFIIFMLDVVHDVGVMKVMKKIPPVWLLHADTTESVFDNLRFQK